MKLKKINLDLGTALFYLNVFFLVIIGLSNVIKENYLYVFLITIIILLYGIVMDLSEIIKKLKCKMNI